MIKHNIFSPAVLMTLKLFGVIGYCIFLFWVTGIFIELFTSLLPLSRAKLAIYFEPITILLMFIVCIILTRRIIFSLFLVTGLYVLFMVINAEMMRVFELVFSPIDFKHSIQLFIAPEIWADYWIELCCVVLFFILVLMLLLKTKPNKWINQYKIYLFSAFLIVTILIGSNRNKVAETIDDFFPIAGKVRPINLSERNGFLFGFFYRILNYQPIEQPKNYNQEEIEKIIAKYSYVDSNESIIKPDIIIFFIEAFADPVQMSIKTNYDPIPNFRMYAKQSLSGLVVSPELGGRSANPEFELLTGLSMRFVPEKSIPYIDYLNKPIPSLSRVYNEHGYTSNAIHVANLAFFNYKNAYKHLGFDNIYTLFGRNNVEKDARNLYPSDNALVDDIIRITETNESPQFIFSFPNSTHSHWDYDAYNDSDLDVFGEYSENGKQLLRTYINAIHTADKAIGKLIRNFEKSHKPTVVMVLGDHQPSLPEFRQSMAIDYFKSHHPNKTFKSRKQINSEFSLQLKETYHFDSPLLVDIHRKSHQVPYFIWNNFDNKSLTKNTSMNLLSAPLLSMTQTSKNPLYNLIDKIYNNIYELHKKSIIEKEQNQLIQEYELLQYDIMNGKQFYRPFIKNQ